MSPLERAAGALASGAEQQALESLVEAWRERRSPTLAELVDLLDSKQARRPYAAILASNLKQAHARLQALADSDDPRLATCLVDALLHPPYTTLASRDFWTRVFDVAIALRDPRFRELAGTLRRAAPQRFSSAGLRAQILQALARLEQQAVVVRPATPDEERLEQAIASRLEPVRTARHRESALLAEIYADPYANGPRQVYADVLAERGEPRGEFITLQLAGDLDETRRARMRELYGMHAKRWLGDLSSVISAVPPPRTAHPADVPTYTEFTRGFVSRATILQDAEKRLPLTWTEPGWATVEILQTTPRMLVPIVRHAPLYALRELRGWQAADLTVFRERAPLPYLASLELQYTRQLDERTRELVARCDGLPGLRRLRFKTWQTFDHAIWVLGTPVAKRLEQLTLGSVADGPAAVEKIVGECLAMPATVPTLVIEVARASIELRRGESGVYERVAG